MKHTIINIGYLLLAIFIVMSVIAISGLTVIILEKPKLQSNCPSLIEQHQDTGVPAHIQIKCREHIK